MIIEPKEATNTDSTLRMLVDNFRQVQKNRISWSQRRMAKERGDDEGTPEDMETIRFWEESFQKMEDIAKEHVEEAAGKYDIINEMVKIKGVGLLSAAKVISMIDIHRSNTVSALWRYAGYGVGDYWADKDGKIKAPVSGRVIDTDGLKVLFSIEPKDDWEIVKSRDRLIKGYLSPFNRTLKSSCYLVATSFLKSGSRPDKDGNQLYRRVYDDKKEYYEANRDWTKGHIHNAALRKMILVWLSHVWARWRAIEGLEVTALYVNAKLGHVHYYSPEEFGWGSVNAIGDINNE